MFYLLLLKNHQKYNLILKAKTFLISYLIKSLYGTKLILDNRLLQNVGPDYNCVFKIKFYYL